MNTTPDAQEQRRHWNALAPAWVRWREVLEAGDLPVSLKILELAALRSGDQVLDIATGLGELALEAARIVGPAGRVIGVDIAEDMIRAAWERRGQRTNVAFVGMDAETYTPAGRYEVVLSRSGLMFLPGRARFLRDLRRHMAPGGRLVFSTWSHARHVPLISLAEQLFARELGIATPSALQPHAFSMADEGRVLAELRDAGFRDPVFEPVLASYRFGKLAEFVEFSSDLIFPSLGDVIAHAAPNQVEAIWAAFLEAARRFVQPDGSVALPALSLCFAASA